MGGLLSTARQLLDRIMAAPTRPSALREPTQNDRLDDFDRRIEADDPIEDVEMGILDHFEELRQRIFAALLAVLVGISLCFAFVKPIVKLLELPAQGVRFLQLSPGEFFFVSIQVAGYSGLLISSPFVIYQIIQFILPGLKRSEKQLLAPIVFGSTFLFAGGLAFAYEVLIPATLRFFESYGGDVVEQLWSIDKYFRFILTLLFCTGLVFQVPVIQYLLGRLGLVTAQQMFSNWRSVILGAAILAAVLTPSTDPLTQTLLAVPVIGLYFGGAGLVALTTPKP